MNILIMASESGIDLESKTLEVLMELEQPSFFGAKYYFSFGSSFESSSRLNFWISFITSGIASSSD